MNEVILAILILINFMLGMYEHLGILNSFSVGLVICIIFFELAKIREVIGR